MLNFFIDYDNTNDDQFNPIHSIARLSSGFLLTASDDKNINKWSDNNNNINQKRLLSHSLDSYSTTLSVNSKSFAKVYGLLIFFRYTSCVQ